MIGASRRHAGAAAVTGLAAVLLALALPARPLAAQSATARMAGRVMDRSSSAGLARAEVVLQPEGPHVVTDSSGDFVFFGLPAGTHRFIVRAAGFPPTAFDVELRRDEESRRIFHLDSTHAARAAQELAPVTVTAEAPERNYRLVDFERRRRTGRGQYLSEEQIERTGASTLTDLTRGMRGVATRCGGGGGCRISMVRARPGCEPEYVVDGRVDNMFGRLTPIRDIIALELYTGPSDVPGEFAGTNAGCGVVVIWTRTGPKRRSSR